MIVIYRGIEPESPERYSVMLHYTTGAIELKPEPSKHYMNST